MVPFSTITGCRQGKTAVPDLRAGAALNPCHNARTENLCRWQNDLNFLL